MRFNQLISLLKQGQAGLLSYQIGKDPEILSGASLEKANIDQISFLEKGNSLSKKLNSCNAGAVILPIQEDLSEIAKSKGLPWAVVKDPRIAFAEVLETLNPASKKIPEIHPTAVIGDRVTIGEKVSIGPHVCIGDDCEVGEDSIIHAGVVIYSNVVIGSGNELHANCVIHPGSKTGKNCIIHSSTVIGSEGFGFIPTRKGWRKMPQTGIVIIEDNVEIGCNSAIDRPAVGETRIGNGTKIDNLVQIAHGVITGKDCAMASQVGIAGGAVIGNGVILAGQVGVTNRVKVGDGVIASSKCGIHTDIDPGAVISGFPAIPNRLWLRCSANFKRLPDLTKAIKEISKSLPR